MSLSKEIKDLEKDKFIEVDGKPAIRVSIVGGDISVSSVAVEEKSVIDIVSNELIYFGYATIGSNENTASWKIIKMTIIGSIIKSEYAQGVSTYTNIWDDRTTYSYS